MIATTVSICESKMGNEGALVDTWLRRQELVVNSSAGLIHFYNQGFNESFSSKRLPPDYHGPVKSVESFRANHGFDHSMFNENGAVHCSEAGLEAILDREDDDDMFRNFVILDIHGATKNACNDTTDGRHYRGLTRRRQVSLLLRGAGF
jgi:hypothetical protein